MSYLYRRLIFYLVALWAAVTLNFAIPRMMPGNPAEVIYAQHSQQLSGNPHALDAIKASLGLSDDPMPLQYWHYLVNLVHGNLGTSFFYGPVTDIIRDRMPWTLFLLGMASLLAFILGTMLGIYCSWRRGGIADSILVPVTALTSSFPTFFLSLLFVYYVGYKLGWFPTGGSYEQGTAPHLCFSFLWDMTYHAILPAFVILITSIGGWVLGMRNAMINTLAEDYVQMAVAKGLHERRVMVMYAARNAILPQITGFAMAIAFIVGGAFLTELVFNYQGVGFALINAVNNLDYPLLQGLLLFITCCVLFANLVADLIYARLDPRVRRT